MKIGTGSEEKQSCLRPLKTDEFFVFSGQDKFLANWIAAEIFCFLFHGWKKEKPVWLEDNVMDDDWTKALSTLYACSEKAKGD